MFIISLIIIALITAADQIIKAAVVNSLDTGEIIKVIHFGDFDVFSLTRITNKGAAWSMMEGKTWFLVGFPIVVIIGGLIYMYLKRSGSKLLLVSLALLIGGGIGNLIDRIRLGEVVDYIRFEPVNFPIFNFADICVVFGVITLAVYFLFFDKPSKKDSADTADKTDTPAEQAGAEEALSEPVTLNGENGDE